MSEAELFIKPLDICIAVVSFTVFVIGVPGNILGIMYFITRGRDLPTRLYSLLSIIDTLLCFCILPVATSLATERKEGMFKWGVFCTLWGVIWTWAPYMSVFLTAVLSITRTLVLLRPLRIIRKDVVMIIVALYGCLIAVRTLAPIFIAGPTYIYLKNTPECGWDEDKVGKTYSNISLYTVVIFLALPILPIFISCILSIHVIRSSIQQTKDMCSRSSAKRSATQTIIILTMTYVILNLPLFVYLVGFTFYYIPDNLKNWLGGSTIADVYLWGMVYTIMTGINSLANFVIYVLRIKQFRFYITRLFRRSAARMNLSHVNDYQQHTTSPVSPVVLTCLQNGTVQMSPMARSNGGHQNRDSVPSEGVSGSFSGGFDRKISTDSSHLRVSRRINSLK